METARLSDIPQFDQLLAVGETPSGAAELWIAGQAVVLWDQDFTQVVADHPFLKLFTAVRNEEDPLDTPARQRVAIATSGVRAVWSPPLGVVAADGQVAPPTVVLKTREDESFRSLIDVEEDFDQICGQFPHLCKFSRTYTGAVPNRPSVAQIALPHDGIIKIEKLPDGGCQLAIQDVRHDGGQLLFDVRNDYFSAMELAVDTRQRMREAPLNPNLPNSEFMRRFRKMSATL